MRLLILAMLLVSCSPEPEPRTVTKDTVKAKIPDSLVNMIDYIDHAPDSVFKAKRER